jgi:hypothetical protein
MKSGAYCKLQCQHAPFPHLLNTNVRVDVQTPVVGQSGAPIEVQPLNFELQ